MEGRGVGGGPQAVPAATTPPLHKPPTPPPKIAFFWERELAQKLTYLQRHGAKLAAGWGTALLASPAPLRRLAAALLALALAFAAAGAFAGALSPAECG